MERIPEDLIEKVRSSNDIVDVISDYVPLKKQGRNYFGLCPFHGEKSPSFSVSPDKQIYHCFGCGAGGNVFSFLMNIEGYTFIEAVTQLGKKSDIELPQIHQQNFSEKSSDEKRAMTEIHELLAKLYHHCLLHTKQGRPALEYLEKRGFTRESIERFQIGFAPDSWETASQFLQKRGMDLHIAEKVGLIGKRQSDGKPYDRFRNRVMFPIWDRTGAVVAFGGRVLDGKDEPKYLNSPESKIFQKGRTLYGLNLARAEMRQKQHAVIFEGYVDTIAAYRAGVTNGVATLGTSLTEDHAAILKRNVQSVTICYDSDRAGVEAAFRASEILTKQGCTVKISQMPDGMDPDDYISQFGNDSFLKDIIGASLTVMAFKIQYYRRGKNLRDEGERMIYIEEIIQEIARLPKAVERDHYLRQIASEFNLSLDALKQQQTQTFKQLQRSKDNGPKKRDNNFRIQTLLQKSLLPRNLNAERIVLAHMLKSEEAAFLIQEKLDSGFNVEEHNAIAAYLYAFYEEGNKPNVGLFMQRIDDDKLRKLASELAMLTISEELNEIELADYIRIISSYPLLREIQEKEKQQEDAIRRNEIKLAAQIAQEIMRMKRSLK
ncbi:MULTISPECIES: DNA primase [Fictibacillus]|jgi:DNA primase|uniref:DNA primase n=1 Tax=Fictibacillus TaxID=1329200 RepID=UPI0018CCF738|nr:MULTISPECIES: DNA primase [unclassified Fictibacillus]MBH0158487.1 DNA primase [Fictibacillus sp. 5RED26]MBH0160067.1 DNA primase [Fictibacillus sp. 26RED30]